MYFVGVFCLVFVCLFVFSGLSLPPGTEWQSSGLNLLFPSKTQLSVAHKLQFSR